VGQFTRPQERSCLSVHATLLPDGRVFIAGGITGGADGGPCEIFDPRNPGAGWVEGPNIKFERTYHSSFILLQDGSILGGGAPPNVAFSAVQATRALLSRLLRQAAAGESAALLQP